MTADTITSLNGAADLYSALRASGLGPADLPEILAGVDAATATRLRSVDQGLLRAVLRVGAGLAAVPDAALRQTLDKTDVAQIFDPAILSARHIALPMDGQHPDMPACSDPAFDAWFAATGAEYGLGLYGEHRSVYATPQFADAASPERRTVHLGIDVFAPAGTPVYAPLPGRVRHVTYQSDPLDYGNALIVDHNVDGVAFHTLYGHLGGSLPGLLAPGDTVAAGQLIAHLGDWPENGGWAPHLHFQIMSDMLEQSDGNFFGVGHQGIWDVWQVICPDPNLILRLPPQAFAL